MPELPEVETIARGLEPLLLNDRFESVQIFNPGTLKIDPGSSLDSLPGCSVHRVWRRAKLLMLTVDNDRHLAFHLKMTGKLLLEDQPVFPVDKHTRLIFSLASGSRLLFHDVRKFGYCRFLNGQELQRWRFYQSLGPEPLELQSEHFVSLFADRRSSIKSLLLNQEVLAGIGNIYADEALHSAGIHPSSIGSELEPARLRQLHESLQEVLNQALKARGSSLRDYVDGLGRRGGYQDAFKAYGRAGRPCLACGCTLERLRVAGRSTVCCPKCQKK